MIELSPYQFTLFSSIIIVVVWLIRLESKIIMEKALREQFEKNLREKDQAHSTRITGLEGRILDELRKLENSVMRVADKLDGKQDKPKE